MWVSLSRCREQGFDGFGVLGYNEAGSVVACTVSAGLSCESERSDL